MEMSLSLTRIFFIGLSVLFASVFASEMVSELSQLFRMLVGAVSGVCFAGILIFLELYVNRFNIRTLNILSLGIFFGSLLGYSVLIIFNAFIEISGIPAQEPIYSAMKIAIFLASIYFGLTLTIRSAGQLDLGLPKSTQEKKRDLIVDSSILYDLRIIDLAASGLLDNHLVIPRFLLREIQENLETGEESNKNRARKSLEILRRLEEQNQLAIRYVDTDFIEVKESATKLIRLARLLDANIITADMNRIQQSMIESTERIRVINIHVLSNALKPITHAGEHLLIKIRRKGNEPRQGVGYLEDGTMVVVNGGEDFIGLTIKVQVLSVKGNASGRMIFCNALEELVGASFTDQKSIGIKTIHSEKTQSSFFL